MPDTEQADYLYFGFGANMALDAMAERCPDAEPVAPFLIQDWRLVFRGVADVVPAEGHVVPGAVWRISKRDERALDRFEGFPGFYGKTVFEAPVEGERRVCMLYAMQPERKRWPAPPNRHYWELLRQGYKDWDLPLGVLDEALRHAGGRGAEADLFELDAGGLGLED